MKIITKTKKFKIFFLLILTAGIMLSPFGILYASADEIERTVPVANVPQRVAVNEATNTIFVSSGDAWASPPIEGKVTVIDGSDYSVTTLNVGGSPKGMAVDKNNNKIYVANKTAGSVAVIDGESNAIEETRTGFDQPVDAAWNAGLLYILEYNKPGGGGAVKIIDGTTKNLLYTVSLDTYPVAMAVNGMTDKIYVAYENGNVIVINDTNHTVIKTLTAGYCPESIAVNTATNKIYVANAYSHDVTVIDGTDDLDDDTVVETIAIESPTESTANPWGIAVNESTNKIYVANQGGFVSVIDGVTNTVVQTLDVPGNANPIAVAVDQTRNKIYALTLNGNYLTAIDGSIIEAASVDGLTAPVTGATPDASLTVEDERYEVTGLTWENLDGDPAELSGGNFANPGNTYQARIELTADLAHYRFPAGGLTPTVNAGMPTAGTTSSNNLGNKLTFVVAFPADITTTSLGALATPAAGATPAAVSDLISGDPDQYTVTNITWEAGGIPADFDDSDGKFPDGNLWYGSSWYRARIVLTSQPGYKFPAGGLTPDVDGDGTAEPGTAGGGDISGNTLTFVVTFSNDLQDYETYISELDPPAAGRTPQTAGDLTLSYPERCTVSGFTWQNSDGNPATLSDGQFVSGGSTYRAVIELTSETGYKFPPDGLTPTVDDDGTFVSGVVSGGNESGNKFTFVITFSHDITAAAITGLVAPMKGAVPVTYEDLTAGNLEQYYVSYMMWMNSDNDTVLTDDDKFNPGSTYKARIYLASNTGYKFPLSGLTPTVDVGTLSAIIDAGYDYYASSNSLTFEVAFPATASDTPDTGNGSGGGGGDKAADLPDGTKISGLNTSVSTQITTNMKSGSADIDLSVRQGGLTLNNNASITVPPISGISSYSLGVPADSLSDENEKGSLTLNTNMGSITLPSNMLAGVVGTGGSKADISIGQGDKDTLPDDVKAIIGDRPLVSLSLSIDGKQTDWSNPGAPVTVSIPYEPTAAELANPESIVVWYIDGSGNVVTVPNGHYNPATGTVTFDITHFSDYAVVYNPASFGDVPETAWYYKAVSFIASREITGGTGSGSFSPDAKLKRGDFLVLLMKAYGIAPDVNPADNFSDAGNTYYTGYLSAAKRLGITAGAGNNMYAPAKEITRQEMFTLLYNTLKAIGQLPEGSSGKNLGQFSDAGQIDTWAKDAMTLLVETGTVGGSNGKLTPASTTTRAEMAQVLYNLMLK